MDRPFLVANPQGVFICLCRTMEEVNTFIDKFIRERKWALDFVCGYSVQKEHFQVRDLREVPIFEG